MKKQTFYLICMLVTAVVIVTVIYVGCVELEIWQEKSVSESN